MIVTVDDKMYMIQWKHRLPAKPINKMDAPVPRGGWRNQTIHGGTTCTIRRVEDDDSVVEIARAVLSCYYKDTFCKEVGRKYSLTEALHIAGCTRPERTVIWKQYFNRNKHTPK